jgi:hypothetical protein
MSDLLLTGFVSFAAGYLGAALAVISIDALQHSRVVRRWQAARADKRDRRRRQEFIDSINAFRARIDREQQGE